MALTDTPAARPYRHGRHLYVRAPEPIDFRSGESLEEAVSETKRHLENRTTLYLLLKDALTNTSIGSDQFVHWDASDARKCLSPDLFVKVGSTDQGFDTWKVWQRGTPDMAVEIVSRLDYRDADWEAKLARYRASGIAEVVRFDAEDEEQPIRVWDRVEEDLVERSPEDPHLRECVTLGLWWVVVPSELGPMLRLARQADGRELLPTPNEERMRLARELTDERKARSQAEHDRMLAEQKVQREAEGRAREAEGRAREAEGRAREAEGRAREAAARGREAEARAKAERERDAAIAEKERLLQELEEVRRGRR